MMPAITTGLAASAMTSMERVRTRSLPSSVTIFSPSAARRTTIRVAGQEPGVEGVERLAALQHDEIADIDDVVDRPQADGAQAVLQPRRAGADFHAGDDVRGVGGQSSGASTAMPASKLAGMARAPWR